MNTKVWKVMTAFAVMTFTFALGLWPAYVHAASPGIEEVYQNGRTVQVTVEDDFGPVVGANILVKGTTIGSITDLDGHATIENVPADAVLTVSFIGYQSQDVKLAPGASSITVKLIEDTNTLDEVVVVGYGTQAKKDITGSVAVVDRDALTTQPVSSFVEALQGQASGVYVSNSGGPGGETTIRIRGVGSVNGSDPLIIVDGIQGISVNTVNPNDIESMQVLKDASATAIYGAKAANGVIIITTKQGSKGGKVNVSYNAYVGFSKMANSGYDMLGAWDFMDFVGYGMENAVKYKNINPSALTHEQFGSYQDGLKMPYSVNPKGFSKELIISTFGSIENWEASYDDSQAATAYVRSAYYQMLEDGHSEAEARKGTNWFDMISQTGLVTNHELSVQGGGDKGMYSIGLGYLSREGTVLNSGFERYSARVNTTFNPTKHFTIGLNSNASLQENTGERGNQDYNSIFASTYEMQTWIPVYNIGGGYAGSGGTNAGRNQSAYMTAMNAKGDWSRNARVSMAVFAEVKDPWVKGLTLKSQFSGNLGGSWSRTFSERTNMSNKEGSSFNQLTESSSYTFSWQWTNTATYKHTFNDVHDVTLMAGMEAISEGIGRNMSASRIDYIFEKDQNTWTLDNGSAQNLSNSGGMGNKATMFGYFGRADYSFKGKYLATFTIRRDASSKFSSKNRWGTFPSLSLGWRISDEKFMDFTDKWLDDLKIRAGYGTTGNSNIGAYNYAFQYATGNNYLYSIDGENSGASSGYGLSNLGDSNAKWETTKMFNVGFDATILRNLTTSFDFYVKTTSDMLVSASWSSQVGQATKPNVNVGNIRNVGWDWSIAYRLRKGDWNFNASFNISQYKNKVIKLGASDLYYSTQLANTNITTEGQPVGMFYGYQIDGIYKSEADVLNYKGSDGKTILPYAIASEDALKPTEWVGRYKYKDVNGDGKIDSNDKTIVGNPHPDFTGGLNLSIGFKNWDLSTYFYYSIGNDLFAMYEYFTHFGAMGSNYSNERLKNSWDPVSNPNGTYPMWFGSSYEASESGTQGNSNYVKDGSYLRMQTLTLGYTFPSKWIKKSGLSKLRLYVQASNLFTITKYPGLDPEVRNTSDLSKGIDYGSYGVPRQFIFGVNVSF